MKTKLDDLLDDSNVADQIWELAEPDLDTTVGGALDCGGCGCSRGDATADLAAALGSACAGSSNWGGGSDNGGSGGGGSSGDCGGCAGGTL